VSITTTLKTSKRTVYGCYAWLILSTIVIACTVALFFTPSIGRRRYLASWAAKLFFLLIGAPVKVEGTTIHESCVVIANHSSYLDGIILTAALPPKFTYIIKQEMTKIPVAGFVLRRLGSEFVNRENEQHRNRVARRLLNAAQSGESLVFFPEGTFDEIPGLKRFRLGAFGAAWRSHRPLFPVVISGARQKLPANTFLPSPGPLSVRICNPLHPEKTISVEALMQRSRKIILQHLNEPDRDRAEKQT